MQVNFEPCLVRVLVYEGGKVNDPHDPGGKTNQGITQTTFTAYLRTNKQQVRDVFTLTDQERDAIYKSQFWDQIQGDALPTGLDLALFDAAVNSGPAQAIKWLQACMNGVTPDGVFGDKTMQGVLSDPDVTDLIEGVCSRRLAMLQHLSTWQYFGKGWSARVANVQKTACAWADNAPIPSAPDLSGFGGQAKGRVTDLKPPRVSQITAHMSTAATGAATVASQAAQQVQGLQDTFAWVKYVFGGLTLLSVLAGVIALFASKVHDAVEAGTATAVVDLDADTTLPGTSTLSPKGA